MKGIIGNEKGVLIKYAEVMEKLKIPAGYHINYVLVLKNVVRFSLCKSKELNFNSIITKMRDEDYYYLVPKEEFCKLFNIKMEHFDAKFIHKENSQIYELYGFDLGYCFQKDLNFAFLWVREDTFTKEYFIETKE